jgi:hypothetical protein
MIGITKTSSRMRLQMKNILPIMLSVGRRLRIDLLKSVIGILGSDAQRRKEEESGLDVAAATTSSNAARRPTETIFSRRNLAVFGVLSEAPCRERFRGCAGQRIEEYWLGVDQMQPNSKGTRAQPVTC